MTSENMNLSLPVSYPQHLVIVTEERHYVVNGSAWMKCSMSGMTVLSDPSTCKVKQED